MKLKSKILALLMSTVMVLGMFGFAACETQEEPPKVTPPPQTEHVDPPEKVQKVHAISVQYNGSTVNGTLSADLSMKTLTLESKVNKDEGADGTVTYRSSVETVAAVDAKGVVTLKSAGETVISAEAGAKKTQFVLVVGDSYSSSSAHTVTVNGGKAYGEGGTAVTSAKEGEFLTLEAEIPAHMDFIEWKTEDGLWMNGNVFKMPDHDVEITADYRDMLYTLNLVGAKVSAVAGAEAPAGESGGHTESGTEDEYKITVYHIAFGSDVAIEAIGEPEGKMFVGWDYGAKDNRAGDAGVGSYEFAMPDSTLTVWAVFSDLKTKVLTQNVSGYNCTTISDGVAPGGDGFPDAALERLSGCRIRIPGNTAASTDNPENIMGSDIESIKKGTQLIKAIFRNNHESLSVTVELYVTYYGIKSSSGNVTVAAGETKTVYFPMSLGVVTAPWWGFAVREAVGGSGSDMIDLDMVVGAAPMYPDGDKLLSVSGNAEYVKLGDFTKVGWARDLATVNEFGSTHVAIYGPNFTQIPAYICAPIMNMPAYDPENPTTYVYVRVVNNVNNNETPINTLAFAVSSTNNPLESPINRHDLQITKIGETFVFRLAIPRTADDEGKFFFSIIKPVRDSSDTYWGQSFSCQLTFNNVMGYEEA